jgi:WD40 repeat protein
VVVITRRAEGRRPSSCVVWDLATRERVAEFDVPASTSPPGAVFSPDGTRLVVALPARGEEGRPALLIAGYELKTGKKLAEMRASLAAGSVALAAADRTTAVVVNGAGRVLTVDYAAGRIGEDVEQLPARGEPPFQGPVVFSADGKRFATGVVGEAFTTYGVRVYDWPRRKALHTYLGHAGPVTALRFTPDGKYLASGSQDTSVLLWDLTKLPGGK